MGRLSDFLLAQAQASLFNIPAPEYPHGIPKDVCDLFEKLAIEVNRSGFKRYSADAVLHRIRWAFQIERGNREFKCNDHWTAPLARWFLKRHPELPKFFELRASPSTGDHQ